MLGRLYSGLEVAGGVKDVLEGKWLHAGNCECLSKFLFFFFFSFLFLGGRGFC